MPDAPFKLRYGKKRFKKFQKNKLNVLLFLMIYYGLKYGYNGLDPEKNLRIRNRFLLL
jgi:hypothetical protein